LKCFIAMAFGHEDTDRVYDRLIVPTLRNKQIDPIRVDRLEHNDDIDNRIIQEIREADLLIADLTYARPSVYYEAGFAERTTPVIYTVRRDHFAARTDDQHGNFRVHFDLQMKNVIDWIEPNDPDFANRLASRIDYVTKPLRSRREAAETETKEKVAFRSLAIGDRVEEVRMAASGILSSAGFTPAPDCTRVFGHNGINAIVGEDRWYLKSELGVLTAIELSFHTTATESPYEYVNQHPDYNLNLKSGLDKLTAVNELTIECAFHAVPFLNVCLKMPNFRADQEQKILFLDQTLKVPNLDVLRVGEVYCGFNEVKSSVWNYLGLSTGEFPVGFDVQRVTEPMSSIKALTRNGFRFVYDGFTLRTIPRRIRYALIDEIDSLALFRRRLNAVLEDCAVL
jgi:nucleoside 2-deoxyribosyltransferase